MKSTTVARLILIAEVFKGANRCRTWRIDPCEIRAKLLGQSAVAVTCAGPSTAISAPHAA
jgi:hypothetical protein